MGAIDILAPRIDGEVEELGTAFPDLTETTDLALDVRVNDDTEWLDRLFWEAEAHRRRGDKRQALELLGVALRIDPRSDLMRARYFALAAELTSRNRRGDETLQISAVG